MLCSLLHSSPMLAGPMQAYQLLKKQGMPIGQW